MAVHYLKHEIHGTKVACSDLEMAYDKLHGWVEFDPSVPVVKPEDQPIQNVMVKRQYVKKTKEGE